MVERESSLDGTAHEHWRYDIGDFGLPGAMGQEDGSDSEGEGEGEDSSDSGIDSLQVPSTLRPWQPRTTSRRSASAAVAAAVLDEDDQASTSEDELGKFTRSRKGLAPVSLAYKLHRRVKEELKDDLAAFLEEEANHVKEEPPSTPLPSLPRLKSESVAPFSKAYFSAPPRQRQHSRASTSSFIKEESILNDIKPKLAAFSSRSAPSSHTSDGREIFALPGVNTVRNERAVNDVDESDDELSLISSPIKLDRPFKKEEEQELKAPFASPFGSSTSPDCKPRIRLAKNPSTPRLVPVVEIYKRAARTAQSALSSKQAVLLSPSKRRRASPSTGPSLQDESIPMLSADSEAEQPAATASPTKRFRPYRPSLRNVLSLPSPVSDAVAFANEGELPLPRQVKQSCRVNSPFIDQPDKSESSTLSQCRSEYRPASPPPSRESNNSYYFEAGPPVASTSRSPEAGLSRSPEPLKRSRSSKASSRPTPISKPKCFLPTPPPSSQDSTFPDGRDNAEDVFKIPSPPRQRTRSPSKTLSIPRSAPSATHTSPKGIFANGEQTTTPAASQKYKRLGSVIRDVAVRAPDDYQDDDDDGI